MQVISHMNLSLSYLKYLVHMFQFLTLLLKHNIEQYLYMYNNGFKIEAYHHI